MKNIKPQTKNVNINFESKQGLSYWLSHQYINKELETNLKLANLLLVPQEGFRTFEGPIFPVGTSEFFRFLQVKHPPDIKVDICVQDEEYRELALNSDWLILPEIWVISFVAPIAVNLISEYLKKRLSLGNETRIVKVRLIVEEKSGDRPKTVEIFYDGPAKHFLEEMTGVLDELRQSGMKIGESPKPQKPYSSQDKDFIVQDKKKVSNP